MKTLNSLKYKGSFEANSKKYYRWADPKTNNEYKIYLYNGHAAVYDFGSNCNIYFMRWQPKKLTNALAFQALIQYLKRKDNE